jgi:hypothetical protein
VHIFLKILSVKPGAGIATGYGLRIRGSSPGRIFSKSEVHPTSYPMGTGDSFPGLKPQGREADHSPPTNAEVKKNVDLYIHSPLRLHGVVLN